MAILRLRTEVADERGRLGRLATAISVCRGNILGLDVHFLDGARVADEFVIEFPEGGSAEALITALRRAGGVPVEVERLDQHALVDPVAHAIDISARLFAEGSLDLGVERGAAQLVRADRAGLVDDDAEPGSALLRQASEEGAPVVARAHVLTSPDATTEVPWALVVAYQEGPRRRWLVVERRQPPFSSSEIARISALVRLSRAVAGDAQALDEAARARVGPPRPLPRRPGSFRRTATGLRASESP